MRIGLTGGLAAGKSTVGRWLAEAGFTVVDADRLVADLYRSGEPGAQAVEDLFGPEALDENGNVDHDVVAGRVFGDADALESLEKRIHPLVRARFSELYSAASAGKESRIPIVLEAPLLVEAGYAPDFDLIVTVEASPETRIDRAVTRGLSREEATSRLATQSPREVRERAAHRVLTNEGSLEEFRQQVDELISDVRAFEPPIETGFR